MYYEEPWGKRGCKTIKLLIAEDIRDLLKKRQIWRGDVQKVIENAESTGQKFVNKNNSHILAYFKPANVTYWVEYSIKEDGFTIHNAYSHRMEIMEDGKG